MSYGRGVKFNRRYGELMHHSVAQPAIGTNLVWTNTTGMMIQCLNFYLGMTVSAVVVNRYFGLQFETAGGSIIWRTVSTVAQIAGGGSRAHTYYRNNSNLDLDRFSVTSHPLPRKLFLPPGAVVRTTVRGLDAGDQIYNIFFTYLLFR